MGNGTVSSETTIRGLFPALVSADAAHGAVAASSVAAGMGVSLLVMVAALPTTRVGSVDDRKALLSVTRDLLTVQRQLLATLDVDTTSRLVAARAMLQARRYPTDGPRRGDPGGAAGGRRCPPRRHAPGRTRPCARRRRRGSWVSCGPQ